MAKAHDLTGQKFNKLTVLRRIENYVSSGGNSFVQYECVCDCGRHKNVIASKLKNGHVKSCGLLTINCVNVKPEIVCQEVLDFLNL